MQLCICMYVHLLMQCSLFVWMPTLHFVLHAPVSMNELTPVPMVGPAVVLVGLTFHVHVMETGVEQYVTVSLR